MEGTTIRYKMDKIVGDSVRKKNCPAKRNAKVARSQTKNPIKRMGKINRKYKNKIKNQNSNQLNLEKN